MTMSEGNDYSFAMLFLSRARVCSSDIRLAAATRRARMLSPEIRRYGKKTEQQKELNAEARARRMA